MRPVVRQSRSSADDSSGFTMIELLLVVVILGILAAVVVFALGSVTGNAKAAACNADAKTIETAVGAYNANPNGTGGTIGLETSSTTVPAPSNAVVIGFPSTFYTATNAAALISGNELSTWPQETASYGNNNGYLLSLATVDQACSATTVQSTCGTSSPANTNLGLGAKAGQVIVYTGAAFTTALPATAPASVTAASQYATGVVFDNENSSNGCNLL